MLRLCIAFGVASVGAGYLWLRLTGRLDTWAEDRLGCTHGWRLFLEILVWNFVFTTPLTYACLTLLLLKRAG